MRILKSPFKRTERIRFSLDGETLIGSGIGVTVLTPPNTTRGMSRWDVRSDDEPTCFLREESINHFSLLPDGNRIVVDTRTRGIYTYCLSSQAKVQLTREGIVSQRRVCSPDLSQIVELNYANQKARDYRLHLIARPIIPERKRIQKLWDHEIETGWGILDLRYLPDGESLLLLEAQLIPPRTTVTRLARRSAQTGEVLGISPINVPGARRLVISPDQTRIAVLIGHDIVCGNLDHLDGGTTTLTNDTASFFSDIAFHPSSRILAAASNDQSIKFFETDSWTLLGTFTWNSGKMRSVAFSPDGTVAAAGGSAGQVVLWDVDF